MMDYLDKLIRLAQVRGEVNIRCEFQGEWQLAHNEQSDNKGIFHLIEEGECWLTLGDKSFHLIQGDIFFLPRNRPHLVGSLPEKGENILPDKRRQGIFEVQKIGWGTPDLKMFCGAFYYQENTLLMTSLPDYLHLNLCDTSIQLLVQLFLQEAKKQESGNQSVIDSLANVLFIYILRHAMRLGMIGHGVLYSLQDKRLNPALIGFCKHRQKIGILSNLQSWRRYLGRILFVCFNSRLGRLPVNFSPKCG